jgi:RNA polymerase sigma-70 factor (ECF subfamily)
MERVAYVRAAIEQLPVVDREIVRLVYWDGFTQEEVALILGKRATAVRARLSRARKVLHDQLADKGPHDVPGAFRERVIGATEGR